MSGKYCNYCCNTGWMNCYCGGDQCYCDNQGEMECPHCDNWNGADDEDEYWDDDKRNREIEQPAHAAAKGE